MCFLTPVAEAVMEKISRGLLKPKGQQLRVKTSVIHCVFGIGQSQPDVAGLVDVNPKASK